MPPAVHSPIAAETECHRSANDALADARKLNNPEGQVVRLVAHSPRSSAGALVWANLKAFADADMEVRAVFTGIESKKELTEAVLEFDNAFGPGASESRIKVIAKRKNRRAPSEMMDLANSPVELTHATTDLDQVTVVDADHKIQAERELAFDLTEARAVPLPSNIARTAAKRLKRRSG